MIPRELTSLVGRDREVAEIEVLLARSQLLTLRGPGGCGKSRLAVRVAQHAERRLESGAAWVGLASLTEPARVLRTVCAAVGLADRVTGESADALQSHLRDKHMLLVLDSCEHLIDACAGLVSMLLDAAPGVRILVTTREALHVPGETVWLVPSLAVPAAADPPDRILECEAVQLFIERATAACPAFKATRGNADMLARICRRLEGMPLAIELCAARVETLGLEQMAERLESGLPLPAAGGRMGVSRHRTLDATIDWSHALLTDQERTLFRRLAVFEGGASIESMEAVCAELEPRNSVLQSAAPDAADELRSVDVFDMLVRLIDKSLVVLQEDASGARYRLLEPVRRYADQKLRESSEMAGVRGRHSAHFLQLAEASKAKLCSSERADWLPRLQCEIGNLRAGWDYASVASDVQSIQRYAGALLWFWHFGGDVEEGRDRSEAAAAACALPTSGRAAALYAAGTLAWMQGDFATARSRLEESAEIARHCAQPDLLASALRELGNVCMFQADPRTARSCYEESVQLWRQIGDRWGLALALTMLGDAVEAQDGAAEALPIFAESELLFRDLGDRWGIALTLFSLALTAGREGRHSDARRYASESLALRRAEGDPWTIAEGLTLLGELTLLGGAIAPGELTRREPARGEPARGEPARGEESLSLAAESFREALVVYEDLGDRAGIPHVLHNLAAVLAAEGEHARAARLFGASDALAQRLHGRSPYTLLTDAARTADVAALRARCGERDFVAAWADGCALTAAEATVLALAARPQVSCGPEEAELKVFALGEPRVYVGERMLRPVDWTFAKPKELLYYLLCRTPGTKEQIGLDFWPDASTAQLRGRFRTTLHSLRRAVGSPARVLFEDGRYTINRALACSFDVDDFQSCVAQARLCEDVAGEVAIRHLEAAVQLYRGDFLAGMDVGEWAFSVRQRLKRAWIDALMSLGRLHVAAGRHEEGSHWYRQAVAGDDLMEEAHRELIRCYARLGQRGRALRHYDAVVDLLNRELGSPPDATTTTVAERVRRGETV